MLLLLKVLPNHRTNHCPTSHHNCTPPPTGCGSPQWANDQWCNDENNNANCNYDGGACCFNNFPGKVNSVQEACAKCSAVHILKFEILQTA